MLSLRGFGVCCCLAMWQVTSQPLVCFPAVGAHLCGDNIFLVHWVVVGKTSYSKAAKPATATLSFYSKVFVTCILWIWFMENMYTPIITIINSHGDFNVVVEKSQKGENCSNCGKLRENLQSTTSHYSSVNELQRYTCYYELILIIVF